MHENEYCISVSNLKKQYSKNNAYAVNSITFNVKYGTVFGFLGPNGAGKTTTLKILTTLLNPSSGNVHIFTKDLVKNQSEIKKRIGVVSQNPSFEANLTVERDNANMGPDLATNLFVLRTCSEAGRFIRLHNTMLNYDDHSHNLCGDYSKIPGCSFSNGIAYSWANSCCNYYGAPTRR
jgi:ABC-type Na+ transport system ATPase subunit NatA